MRGPTFDALKCDTLRIGHDPTVALSHVWIPATCFFSRANAQRHCWLWLLRGDGQVRALLLPAEHFGRDDLLPELLRLSQREDTLRIAHPALHGACALPDAPIVPLPRWVISWGHPVQRAIRAFADGLDADVLEALGELEVRGAFFGTVQNYNRLARAPAPARARRMQALAEFPAWLAPVMLDECWRPMMFDGDYFNDDFEGRSRTEQFNYLLSPRRSPRGKRELLEAIDRGHDLIGAIAGHYDVDRALVRSPLGREPWQKQLPIVLLALLHALPAHARPTRRADVERRIPTVSALPARLRSQADVQRLARPFRHGWNAVWGALERDFRNLEKALRDCRDFLKTALETAQLPARLALMDVDQLGLAWMARRGPRALLDASRHWHALPTVARPPSAEPEPRLIPLFGALQLAQGHARELLSPGELFAEGESMEHCVGDYWDACRRRGIRIVHLETGDGGKATLQLGFEIDAPDPDIRCQQLAGVGNAAPSAALRALADAVVAQLAQADPGVRAQIALIAEQVLRDREQQESPFRRAPIQRGAILRPLDARLRAQLAQVLAYAQAQDDWCLPDDALLCGAVAGFQHAQGAEVLDELRVGDALELVREPGNPHDPMAIRIDWRGVKLGYVSRGDNAPLARMLDGGKNLTARIRSLDGGYWAPVEFVVMAA